MEPARAGSHRLSGSLQVERQLAQPFACQRRDRIGEGGRQRRQSGLAHAGPGAAVSATANLDIHFLTRPKPADVTAVATMLRLGKRLAVTRVELFSDADLVGHATVTYALPSARPHV